MLQSSRTTPLTSRASSAQSCVDLMDTDTPRGSKILPSPGKDSLDSENRDPGFRTPNLCSRPSFRYFKKMDLKCKTNLLFQG